VSDLGGAWKIELFFKQVKEMSGGYIDWFVSKKDAFHM